MDKTTLPTSNDDRVPWQAVISKFKYNIGTLKFAADVLAEQQRVVNVAQQLMREVIVDWNRSSVTCAVPPEVLATCFSFLSLEELLVATHVSHAWRATALSCPGLWSRASLYSGKDAERDILDLVLQRSGQTLLDIEILSNTDNADILGPLLGCHMHRIRHLTWAPRISQFLLQPSPLLESLTCHMLAPIPENLLGCSPGRLRALRLYSLHLPASCAALATVVSLTVDLNGTQAEAASLVHLFAVCPLLEVLEMNELAELHFAFLVAGTPTRLRVLNLCTRRSSSADLARYVTAWAPANPNLASIDLSMDHDSRMNATDTASLLMGAEVLSVSQSTRQGTLKITDAGGRTCTIVLRTPWKRDYDAISRKIASILAPHSALLGQLRALRAPVTVLSRLFKPAPAMPALRTLTALLQAWEDETHTSWDPHIVFPAQHLSFLSETGHLLDHARVEIVTLLARGMMIYQPDVQSFVDTLATSLPVRDQQEDVEIEVRGLHDELTFEDLPRVKGYRFLLLGQGGGV